MAQSTSIQVPSFHGLQLPPQMKNEGIFNELFNTFLGEESIEECLKKAEWLTSTLEDLPIQLSVTNTNQNTTQRSSPCNAPGTKRKITVKSEPVDYNYTFDGGEEQHVTKRLGTQSESAILRVQQLKTEQMTDQGLNYETSVLDCLTLGMSEEKALKKARRKIKNKISAQESRRKKKEYVEGLERRVSIFSSINDDLKERLSELESINREMQEKILMLTSTKPEASVQTQTDSDT